MKLSLKNWNTKALVQLAAKPIPQRLEIATILLQNDMKERVSEPSPPASQPGEPFHKDTGRVRASISREVDKEKLVGRVGSNMPLFKWLNLGTEKMAARPVVQITLDANRDKIIQILRGQA